MINKLNFTNAELAILAKDNFSCVKVQNGVKHIGIQPYFLNNISNGIAETLNKIVSRYDRELKGIVLTYKNPKILHSEGVIHHDRGQIFVDVEAEFYLFCPEENKTVKAIVNKTGHDYVGCLIHKVFNISVPRPPNQDHWIGQSVNIGDEIFVKITFTDLFYVIPYIRGEIVQIVHKRKIDTEYDSGVCSEDQKKQKTKGRTEIIPKAKKRRLSETQNDNNMLDSVEPKTKKIKSDQSVKPEKPRGLTIITESVSVQNENREKKKKTKKNKEMNDLNISPIEQHNVPSIFDHKSKQKSSKKKSKNDNSDKLEENAQTEPKTSKKPKKNSKSDEFDTNPPETTLVEQKTKKIKSISTDQNDPGKPHGLTIVTECVPDNLQNENREKKKKKKRDKEMNDLNISPIDGPSIFDHKSKQKSSEKKSNNNNSDKLNENAQTEPKEHKKGRKSDEFDTNRPETTSVEQKTKKTKSVSTDQTSFTNGAPLKSKDDNFTQPVKPKKPRRLTIATEYVDSNLQNELNLQNEKESSEKKSKNNSNHTLDENVQTDHKTPKKHKKSSKLIELDTEQLTNQILNKYLKLQTPEKSKNIDNSTDTPSTKKVKKKSKDKNDSERDETLQPIAAPSTTNEPITPSKKKKKHSNSVLDIQTNLLAKYLKDI